MGIKTNVLTMFTACLIARPARRECSCSDDDLREIQMPGVWRVVRGNLGAIPGTRTWQTKLGSLDGANYSPGPWVQPLSIPRSSCDGYFLIRAGLFSPMFFFLSFFGREPLDQLPGNSAILFKK